MVKYQDAVLDRTEGNPLFIVETVRAESEGGAPGAPQHGIPELPPRAHAVIAGRLALLSDHAREVAAAAEPLEDDEQREHRHRE